MAIGATCVWEFQTGGDDTFGGGFTSGGTDYSTATTAQATLTTSSVVGATTTDIVVFATDYTVAATDVGNVMFLTGGSATAGFYEIMSVATGVGQYWRMDRAVGTAGQTCPGKMGGCRKLISSNSWGAATQPGHIAWIKSGSYTLAAFSSVTAGTAALVIQILGYGSTRNDNPTGASRPTLAAGTNAFTPGNFKIIRNFIMTTSHASGIDLGTASLLENCKITSTNATSTNGAINQTTNSRVINCEVINGSGIGIKGAGNGNFTWFSYIHDSATGISFAGASDGVFNSIFSTFSTAAISFVSGASRTLVMNCTLFGAETPAGTGILSTAGTAAVACEFFNNIIYGFTTGVNWATVVTDSIWDYNNFYNNTTDRTNVTAGVHDLALDPQFTNTGTGDFSIGTNLKAAGFPGAFQAGTSTGYLDIGAVQRVEPTGGGASWFSGE